MSSKRMNNAIGPQIRQTAKHPHPLKSLLWLMGLLWLILQITTQILAARLQYHPDLGASWHHLYYPWQAIVWYQHYAGDFPELFHIAGAIAMMMMSLALMLILLLKSHRAKHHINAYLHGSARWADQEDIKQAGLIGDDEGVFVGAYQDQKGRLHYLRHNGPEHILTYAPTRSGKGVGLVMPTLLSWRHSCMITDLKGELWALTAGWRKQYANNKVIRFEPAALHGSARWNPLEEIRIGTEHEVGDVQNLATLMVDPQGKGLETHWQKTAQALLVGLILHAIYKCQHEGGVATFAEIDQMLVDPHVTIQDVLQQMTQYQHLDGKPHPVVRAAARDMLDRPEEEAGSVLSTLKSYLALYRDPVVAGNIACSDFKIKDLMQHQHAVSLYIVTQPNDKTRLQPLVRMLLNMMIRLLTDKLKFEQVMDAQGQRIVQPKQHYKHRLLCLIDEFPSLGKLDILQESLAFVAGYGLKFYLICQDLNQLKSRERGYGPDETITSNCHIQNAFPPNRVETAEHLSKLTGQTTVLKQQLTTSGKRFASMLTQVSHATQEVARPLLTVDECLRMTGAKKDKHGMITEAGDMVIFVAGFPAIYGKQPLYFQDSVFMARAAIAAPDVSDTLRVCLSENEKVRL